MKPWSPTTRYVAFFLSIGLMLWFLSVIQQLIGPLVISCLLAYVLNPIINYVNSISKLPRLWVITIVYALIITLIIIAASTLTPLVIEQSEFLSAELDSILQEFEASAMREADRFGLNIDIQDLFSSVDDFISSGTSTEQIFAVVTATSRNFVWVLIVVVTTFYLLKDWQLLREWLISLAPPDYQGDTRRVYGEIRDVWQAYLWGQLLLMTIIGVLSGVGAAAVGLQGSAVVLGLIAGILDLIPSVGPVVAMVVAMAVAWYEGAPAFLPVSNEIYVLIVLGIFVVIQAIENIWLRPRIMGQSLKMHPAVVFIGVMGGIAIGGILVGLLIVPVIGSVGVIGAYLRAKIFGLDPWAVEETLIPPTLTAENGLPPELVEGIEHVRALEVDEVDTPES